jgi:anti-sigma-K factor RskA
MANRKVPELFVEQVLLGEVSAEKRSEIEGELGAEELDRLVEALRRSDAEILAAHPPSEVAAQIRARLGAEVEASRDGERQALRLVPKHLGSSRGMARIALPLAAAAAVILAAVFLPRLVADRPGPGATVREAVRVKGTPQLMIYRERAGEPELLPDRAVVREGDSLQIRYVPAGRSYGAILSIDGRGEVTLHYPESVSGPTRIEGDKAAALGYAWTLDDAPGFERFFFVTSPQSFAASEVVASAKRLAASCARAGALDLPKAFEQVSVLLVKGE